MYLRCNITGYFLIKGEGVGPVGLGVVDLNLACE